MAAMSPGTRPLPSSSCPFLCSVSTTALQQRSLPTSSAPLLAQPRKETAAAASLGGQPGARHSFSAVVIADAINSL
ncbi:hypothetical protein COCSUDRAFT_34327 [Coccomyxa subellipsoidea C-169]|uniref:Uncharacterized protein n=1 Tax=Coccomyxa subellipsoidea (strain C-169) TaxID=574566 RepID=I0YM70_COCSC|nr:hypothetical protein COCSUDRAFT_34327 [Coccomyxa subellipsoidea C-169]EIE19489.1 hypothetical protein COCSUDRAFT_34327 [Coccomyxa subellipsoidea C-169]|eukprot:XP_005644033.1 hypothetical protein COCSUDRAFT_34327 [Coccomyxa subellipsoidea C-169]